MENVFYFPNKILREKHMKIKSRLIAQYHHLTTTTRISFDFYHTHFEVPVRFK